jgi:hypothetical protein
MKVEILRWLHDNIFFANNIIDEHMFMLLGETALKWLILHVLLLCEFVVWYT